MFIRQSVINKSLNPYVAMKLASASTDWKWSKPITAAARWQNDRKLLEDVRTSREIRTRKTSTQARFTQYGSVLQLGIIRRHFVSRFLLAYFSSLRKNWRLLSQPGPCCSCDCLTVLLVLKRVFTSGLSAMPLEVTDTLLRPYFLQSAIATWRT